MTRVCSMQLEREERHKMKTALNDPDDKSSRFDPIEPVTSIKLGGCPFSLFYWNCYLTFM